MKTKPPKIALETDPVKAVFKNFVYLIWQHLQLPEPTPAQYAICDRLQYGPKRMILEAFRGIGKSWIASAFVLWSIMNNINLKFLIVSASKARADDFSIFCQRLISEVPMLEHLIPDEEQRSSRIAFDVAGARAAHASTVKSVGISGQITGSRADIVVADDCEVVSNSATEDQRDKLLKAVLEFEAVLSPGGRIIYLGTPQCEMSLYNKLRGKGYEAYIWPARYPAAAKIESYAGGLAPEITEALEKDPLLAGHPTDPQRFNELDLIEREAAYGRSGFALQYMLDSTLSDSERYPLKTSDLVVLDVSADKAPITVAWASGPGQLIKDLPNIGFTGDRFYRPLFADEKWVPFEGSVMAIDPHGRGKDETGYGCIKQLHGNLFITAAGGLIGGYDERTLKRLAELAKENQVGKIIIESNFGDGMFTSLFTPVLASIYPCTIEEIRHNTQKERRIIDTLEPLMNKHRLIVTSDVVKQDLKAVAEERTNYSLFYQLTHITKDRGSLKADDRLDALAMAAAYWVVAVKQDEDSSAESARSRALDVELQKFIQHAMGTSPQQPRWIKSGPRVLSILPKQKYR